MEKKKKTEILFLSSLKQKFKNPKKKLKLKVEFL